MLASDQNMKKITHEHENISTIEGLENYSNLESLSLAFNRIVIIENLGFLRELKYLNLSNNSITTISGLNNLLNLEWLDVSDNSIQDASELNSNKKLKYLNLSDNALESLPNLILLDNLQELYLCGNMISFLKTAPNNLPNSIQTISLVNNDIEDITQLSYLFFLKSLVVLEVEGNPFTFLPNYSRKEALKQTSLPSLTVDREAISNKQNVDILVLNSIETNDTSSLNFNSLDDFMDNDQVSLDTLVSEKVEPKVENSLDKEQPFKSAAVRSNPFRRNNSVKPRSLYSSPKPNNSFDARENRPVKSLDPQILEKEISENSQGSAKMTENDQLKAKRTTCGKSTEKSGIPLMACFKKTPIRSTPAKIQKPVKKIVPKQEPKKQSPKSEKNVVIIQSVIKTLLMRTKFKSLTDSRERFVELTQHDKQMIDLQTQAIRRLWQEIENIKKWRENIERPSNHNEESNFTSFYLSQKICDSGYGQIKIFGIHESAVLPSNFSNREESLLPGIPTAPTGLRYMADGDVIILSWISSYLFDEFNNPTFGGLLGYRVYVDGIPRGCVYCRVNAVKIAGVIGDHKLNVRGFSLLGESVDSESIFVKIN